MSVCNLKDTLVVEYMRSLLWQIALNVAVSETSDKCSVL